MSCFPLLQLQSRLTACPYRDAEDESVTEARDGHEMEKDVQ